MDLKKKTETECIVGRKIEEDIFINLSNVAKSLSDYSVEMEGGMEEIVAIDEDQEESGEDDVPDVVEE